MMGVAMLVAGLYLKLKSSNDDISYLFDLTLSLAAIIIAANVIVSTLYFILYNEILVVGILLDDEQRKHQRPKKPKI
jgi:hypothetical protein